MRARRKQTGGQPLQGDGISNRGHIPTAGDSRHNRHKDIRDAKGVVVQNRKDRQVPTGRAERQASPAYETNETAFSNGELRCALQARGVRAPALFPAGIPLSKTFPPEEAGVNRPCAGAQHCDTGSQHSQQNVNPPIMWLRNIR
jgi:hypothetical protein